MKLQKISLILLQQNRLINNNKLILVEVKIKLIKKKYIKKKQYLKILIGMLE